jgi:hypothetical protein
MRCANDLRAVSTETVVGSSWALGRCRVSAWTSSAWWCSGDIALAVQQERRPGGP